MKPQERKKENECITFFITKQNSVGKGALGSFAITTTNRYWLLKTILKESGQLIKFWILSK